MKACIFDIKRFAVHDGPGIRTTVFFKGCPLRCWWCHNPEGISPDIEHFTEKKDLDGVTFDKELVLGRWISQEELLVELEKDRVFMDESGGGVTLSGGEPLMQHEAVFALLAECRKRDIHTAVDTSGFVSGGILQQTTEMADLILYDLKTLDDEIHMKYAGASNKKILNNLEIVLEGRARVILRIPLVAGFNDTALDQQQLVSFLKGRVNLEQVDILPYHPFGTQKYKRFHKINRQKGFDAPSTEKIDALRLELMNAGYSVNIGG